MALRPGPRDPDEEDEPPDPGEQMEPAAGRQFLLAAPSELRPPLPLDPSMTRSRGAAEEGMAGVEPGCLRTSQKAAEATDATTNEPAMIGASSHIAAVKATAATVGGAAKSETDLRAVEEDDGSADEEDVDRTAMSRPDVPPTPSCRFERKASGVSPPCKRPFAMRQRRSWRRRRTPKPSARQKRAALKPQCLQQPGRPRGTRS